MAKFNATCYLYILGIEADSEDEAYEKAKDIFRSNAQYGPDTVDVEDDDE